MMPSIALLAGGLATRLYPITQAVPKSLIQVAGKPFISHQLSLLKKNGFSHVVLCTGHLGEMIADFVGTGERFGLSVAYSADGETLLGTGGAVKKALPLLGETFFVMYGDSYLDINYKSVYEYFLASGREGVMTVIKNRDLWDKSNIVFSDGKIVRYDKTQRTPDMQYIDYGLAILSGAALDIMKGRDCFDLGEIYQDLIGRQQMPGYEVTQRFYEIGSIAGIKETEGYLNS